MMAARADPGTAASKQATSSDSVADTEQALTLSELFEKAVASSEALQTLPARDPGYAVKIIFISAMSLW